MKPNLPEVPDPRLIESMCLRFDHAHGIQQYRIVDNEWREETVEEFARRQEYLRREMRKIYEEVSGFGFYNYPEDE